MQTTLHHLMPEHQSRLKLLTTEIVQAIEPEKIICYGCVSLVQHHWHVSDGCHLSEDLFKCWLLIIPSVTECHNDEAILQLLHNITIPHTTVDTCIYSHEAINEAIATGSPFFTAVMGNGIMLYSVGEPLPAVTAACLQTLNLAL